MTLVEKLINEHNQFVQYAEESPEKDGFLSGMKNAIDIVKNHNGWISVDDELPPNGTKCFVLVDEYDLNKANQAQPSLVEYVRWKNRYFNRIDKTIYKDDHFVCDEKSEVKVTHWFLIPPNPLKE